MARCDCGRAGTSGAGACPTPHRGSGRIPLAATAGVLPAEVACGCQWIARPSVGDAPPRGRRRWVAPTAGVSELPPAAQGPGPLTVEGFRGATGGGAAVVGFDSGIAIPDRRGAALPMGAGMAPRTTGIQCGRAVVTVVQVRVVSGRGLPYRTALYGTLIGGAERKTLWRWNFGGEELRTVGIYPVGESFACTFLGPAALGIEGFVTRRAPSRAIRTLAEVVRERYPPWEVWPWRGLSEDNLGPEVQIALPVVGETARLSVRLPSGHVEVDLEIAVEELPAQGRLRIAGVEVTQAIQHLWSPHGPDNSLPLVAGKLTLVRVFAESGLASPGVVRDVRGQVTAFYPTGSVELRRAMNQAWAEVQPWTTAIAREQWTDGLSFFFEAPAEQVGSGVVAFLCQVERQGQVACQQVSVPFVAPPAPIEIVVCPFEKLNRQDIPAAQREDLAKVRRKFVGELEPEVSKIWRRGDPPPANQPFEGCVQAMFPALRDFVRFVDGGQVRHEVQVFTELDLLALLNLLVMHATPKLPPEEVALALLLIGALGFTFETAVGQLGGQAVPRKLSPRRFILGSFPEIVNLNGFSVPFSPAIASPPRNYAHELAHALGLQHVCHGEVPDRGFVPPDCEVGEVGVDVFHAYGFCLHFQDGPRQFPFVFPWTNGQTADFMDKPPPPRPGAPAPRSWISPYHWVRLLMALTSGAVDLNL